MDYIYVVYWWLFCKTCKMKMVVLEIRVLINDRSSSLQAASELVCNILDEKIYTAVVTGRKLMILSILCLFSRLDNLKI